MRLLDDTGFVCTATAISAQRLLTAGHCVPTPTDRLYACVGADELAFTHVQIHDDLDLAFLELARPLSSRVTPIRAASADLRIGQFVEIAGYCRTEEGGGGHQLRFAVLNLASLSPLATDGLGRGGACDGDSGAPLLVWSAEGLTLAGILTRGSESCRGADEFVDIADVGRWIYGGTEMPEVDLSTCGSIDQYGRCIENDVRRRPHRARRVRARLRMERLRLRVPCAR